MDSDKNIIIVGYYIPISKVFITKISITATNLWYVNFAASGNMINNKIMMVSDGSFLVSDSVTISSKQRPYVSSVSNSGAINWEATYSGYAYNILSMV